MKIKLRNKNKRKIFKNDKQLLVEFIQNQKKLLLKIVFEIYYNPYIFNTIITDGEFTINIQTQLLIQDYNREKENTSPLFIDWNR